MPESNTKLAASRHNTMEIYLPRHTGLAARFFQLKALNLNWCFTVVVSLFYPALKKFIGTQHLIYTLTVITAPGQLMSPTRMPDIFYRPSQDFQAPE